MGDVPFVNPDDFENPPRDWVGTAVFGATGVVVGIGYSFIESRIGVVPKSISYLYNTINGLIGYGTVSASVGDQKSDEDKAGLILSIGGSFIGGPFGAVAGAGLAEILGNIPASDMAGITMYGADGYYPIDDSQQDPDHCFLAGTQVSMWDGTKKPIEQIEAGDIVVSYDKDGNLKPGRVKRTMTNRSKQILDVHGLMVTPGHATLCGDGRFDGQHVPILDILRSDGALVLEDGSKIRACTGCRLGTMGDRMITAIIGEQQPDGLVRIAEVGQIRAGTRFITEDGEDVSVLDMIFDAGGRLTEDGMIQTTSDGPKMPFRWTFTSSLPKPEDYVLQRSATQLQDIYQANEWEAIRPSMPVPMGGEVDQVISRHPVAVRAAPANVPLSLRDRPDAPQMSRKYRRAAGAKARKLH